MSERKLTRRGEAALGLLAVAVSAGAIAVAGAVGYAQQKDCFPSGETVVIEDGDTLWAESEALQAMAGTDGEKVDKREIIACFKELNGIDGTLQSGAVLEVPDIAGWYQ